MRQLRNIECYLSEGNLSDAVASLLYTLNIVRDNEVVVNISVGPVKNGLHPINFTCIEEKEVQLIVHS